MRFVIESGCGSQIRVAAKAFGVPPDTLRRRQEQGTIPPLRRIRYLTAGRNTPKQGTTADIHVHGTQPGVVSLANRPRRPGNVVDDRDAPWAGRKLRATVAYLWVHWSMKETVYPPSLRWGLGGGASIRCGKDTTPPGALEWVWGLPPTSRWWCHRLGRETVPGAWCGLSRANHPPCARKVQRVRLPRRSVQRSLSPL